MGLFKKLKKGIKGVRKALHLPALTIGNAVKLGAAAGLGGPVGLAAAAVKSKLQSAAIGGVKRVLRSKAEKAVVSRVQKLLPGTAGPFPTAVAHPGGAPIVAAARAASPAGRRLRRAAPRKAKSSGKPSKRRAPTGGKDFKALSASWRAAGKPGTWLAWVKSH